jgi:hypothetical protein
MRPFPPRISSSNQTLPFPPRDSGSVALGLAGSFRRPSHEGEEVCRELGSLFPGIDFMSMLGAIELETLKELLHLMVSLQCPFCFIFLIRLIRL